MPMDRTIRCQSCSMPLDPGFFASNADGSVNREWCRFCFKDGAFTNPELTVEQMIEESVRHMTNHLGIPLEEARQRSKEMIPKLKRWES
ncbi:MAG: zinc ribbon domain-containing protein [Patescibacteria group bacterium]|nr:zinc ribbon domain-containing protein [Patescibacteria group bacterium]